jgi:hypothetical protein
VADPIAEREAEVAAALDAWDALPSGERAPVAFRDLLARTQADFVSAGRGLEAANAEIERLYTLMPAERPEGYRA